MIDRIIYEQLSWVDLIILSTIEAGLTDLCMAAPRVVQKRRHLF